MKKKITPLKQQSGVILVVSLIMLLLLTLIGLTGTQVTSLEEKMASNARDQNIAFQAAEATLAFAEIFALQPSINAASFDVGTAGLHAIDTADPNFFNRVTWTGANSAVATNFGQKFINKAGVGIVDPRYIIKLIQSDATTMLFKITARAQGIGANSKTQVVLQEYFERTN